MLEDKSTQTTVRTYIKVTTHSPTHRHIHILAYTQADIMTRCNWLQRLKSVTSKCGPDRVLNGTEWHSRAVYAINATSCRKSIQNKSRQNTQIYVVTHMHPLPEYQPRLLMRTCTVFQWNTATV